MVEPHFVFKGTSTLDLKIVIQEEDMPPVTVSENVKEYVEVPGRDGVLTIDTGRRAPVYKTVHAVLIDKEFKQETKQLLQGHGRLELSNDPDVFYKARISEPVELAPHWSGGWEFDVEFITEPFGYLPEGQQPIEVTTSGEVLTNDWELTRPTITLYGTGDVDFFINNKQIKLTLNKTTTIDSELGIAADADGLVDFKGEFPVLEKGNNEVSWNGSITKAEVTPRWRI